MTADSKADWSQIEHFLHTGQGVTIPLGGSDLPRIDYVVTSDQDIALHLELTSRQRLPRSPHPLIRVEEIAYEGIRMARLRTTQRQLLREFHDLLCAVADRIVDRGRTPDQAFTETVQAWRALLDRPRAMSLEKRIGLMGELVMLAAIAASRGWQIAAESWKASYGEEHDFGLPSYDIEVKTTSAEERTHTVHGLSQLTPSANRPLWLVSLQLTRGGAHGRTFTQCVSSVRDQLAEHTTGDAVDMLEQRLAAISRPDDAYVLPMDDERWSLRSTPLVLMVDEHLPRLDWSLLSLLPAESVARISKVDYNIDVTGLPGSPEPPTELQIEFSLP
ncbi:PD-(D/E)XK motif protein [Streptomyces sp. SID8361]|uniref:PD-(D/E)XK motif protein n=1 Tax=Streptomyces sp. MnatMP-M27 TaxID=1839768 RepID=UPI000B89A0BE|nr:PD-(D/E)XK motif protein [Streptomyces sp. MnatMP-M27]MYU13521.1 PD-(D/E)XK motif protein [Streptomyces sp. SID8361]